MNKNWFKLSLAVCIVSAIGSLALAQRGGRQGAAGGFGAGRGGRGGVDTIGFVLREDVQKELGLSEGDAKDLQSIVEDAQQESRDLRGNQFGNFRDMSAEEREEAMTEMRENSAAITKKARKAVTAKLSSKQKRRYTELEVQYLVQQGNLVGALQAAGEDLKKSDEEKLNEALQNVREEIRRRTAEISRELVSVQQQQV